jgi:predicted kinase
MEAIIFIGIQGSGKSTFFKERFFSTHVRISLDLLKTRFRERRHFETCLETGQRFVVDNTNPMRADRAKYIEPARGAKFKVIGYYFDSMTDDCLFRNRERPEPYRVPDVAVMATAKKLERPSLDEGFDQLFSVQLLNQQFVVQELSL